MTSENLREKLESAKKENADLKRELRQATSEFQTWDFNSPELALKKLCDVMRVTWEKSSREKILTRFRALASGFDVWSKLYRLNSDVALTEQLRGEIDELRELIENQTGKIIPMRMENGSRG